MVATMAEGGNASAGDPSASVMCRLTTKLGEAFAVGGADVGFPTAVTRLGLSRTVNAMLSAKHTDATWDARPFDFLVEGELLRGELGEHMRARGTSIERTLDVEYVLAVPPPQPPRSHTLPDWVSAVASASLAACATRGPELVLIAGCYDGTFGIFDPTPNANEPALVRAALHDDAIAAVCAVSTSGTSHSRADLLITGCKDGTLKASHVGAADPPSSAGVAPLRVRPCLSLVGHAQGIEAVAAAPGGSRVCSAGWDRAIRLWALEQDEVVAALAPPPAEGKQAKRRRMGDAAPDAPEAVSVALASLEAHGDCVKALAWPDEPNLVSGSWDRTVRVWDVAVGRPAHIQRTEHAVFCVDAQPHTHLTLFGGPGGHALLWDPRAEGVAGAEGPQAHGVRAAGGKRGACLSGVRWHATSPWHFACVDYAGHGALWDVRCLGMPLHAMPEAHAGKALCVAWAKDTIASGGEDKRLAIHDVAVTA